MSVGVTSWQVRKGDVEPDLCRVSLRDVQRTFAILFPGPMPAILETRFREAWALVGSAYTAREQHELRRAMETVADLEALEFAARIRGSLPALSAQVRLMSFLAETLPEVFPHYVNRVDAFCTGWAALAWAGVRSAWKLSKGLYLLWRLDVG